MATDPLEALRLTLMQDVLPVGMAVVERARRGGPRGVAEAFTEAFSEAADPLGRLREEGEPAARELRDSLDRLQPGLGNPVLKVQVREMEVAAATAEGARSDAPAVDPQAERAALQQALLRIGDRLALLEQRLTAEI